MAKKDVQGFLFAFSKVPCGVEFLSNLERAEQLSTYSIATFCDGGIAVEMDPDRSVCNQASENRLLAVHEMRAFAIRCNVSAYQMLDVSTSVPLLWMRLSSRMYKLHGTHEPGLMQVC